MKKDINHFFKTSQDPEKIWEKIKDISLEKAAESTAPELIKRRLSVFYLLMHCTTLFLKSKEFLVWIIRTELL